MARDCQQLGGAIQRPVCLACPQARGRCAEAYLGARKGTGRDGGCSTPLPGLGLYSADDPTAATIWTVATVALPSPPPPKKGPRPGPPPPRTRPTSHKCAQEGSLHLQTVHAEFQQRRRPSALQLCASLLASSPLSAVTLFLQAPPAATQAADRRRQDRASAVPQPLPPAAVAAAAPPAPAAIPIPSLSFPSSPAFTVPSTAQPLTASAQPQPAASLAIPAPAQPLASTPITIPAATSKPLTSTSQPQPSATLAIPAPAQSLASTSQPLTSTPLAIPAASKPLASSS